MRILLILLCVLSVSCTTIQHPDGTIERSLNEEQVIIILDRLEQAKERRDRAAQERNYMEFERNARLVEFLTNYLGEEQ